MSNYLTNTTFYFMLCNSEHSKLISSLFSLIFEKWELWVVGLPPPFTGLANCFIYIFGFRMSWIDNCTVVHGKKLSSFDNYQRPPLKFDRRPQIFSCLSEAQRFSSETPSFSSKTPGFHCLGSLVSWGFYWNSRVLWWNG